MSNEIGSKDTVDLMLVCRQVLDEGWQPSLRVFDLRSQKLCDYADRSHYKSWLYINYHLTDALLQHAHQVAVFVSPENWS